MLMDSLKKKHSKGVWCRDKRRDDKDDADFKERKRIINIKTDGKEGEYVNSTWVS